MSANRRRRSASAASAIAAERATTAAAAAEAISTAPSKEQLSPAIAGGSASADEDLLEMPRICRCCCKRDLKLLGLFEASQPTLANTTVASASVASNKSSGTLAKTCATEAETETPQTLSANPVNPGTKATSSPSEAATTLSASTHPASASFSSTSSSSTSTSPMRRRTTNTTAPSAPPAPRGRSSDNAVDYTLSGAHSSMDIVLEEMTIWMLNANKLNCLAIRKNQKLKSWLYGRPLIAESGQRQRYFPANYTAPATCVAPLRRNSHDQVAVVQKHLSLPLLLLLLLLHYSSLITNKSRMVVVVVVAEEGVGKTGFLFLVECYS
ncbi:GD21110 [Drosophila simulans]|uniref:GD21110 n=1 Tax=Drosophila simulans TaxID=7240 RepID=B4QTP1_DROSI|nr:GD21110 [Drosophila simulans]